MLKYLTDLDLMIKELIPFELAYLALWFYFQFLIRDYLIHVPSIFMALCESDDRRIILILLICCFHFH